MIVYFSDGVGVLICTDQYYGSLPASWTANTAFSFVDGRSLSV